MPDARRGIALVLITGLTVLFGIAGMILLRTSALSGMHGASSVQAAQARLAAGAGLDYAAARLWQDPLAFADRGLPLAADNRGDDWASRGNEPPATAPARLSNPSFARGEPWIDAAPADGAYVPGTDSPAPGGDLDGDGALDVRSGRLRGSPGTLAFSLRIASAGGCVCINSWEEARGTTTWTGSLTGTTRPRRRQAAPMRRTSTAPGATMTMTASPTDGIRITRDRSGTASRTGGIPPSSETFIW